MRTPAENKGALLVATGDKCPRCGRKDGACRPVPLGHFCQRDGLAEDTSRRIHPSPDPVAVAVKTDPAVLTARLDEQLAQEAYDKLDAEWKDALGRLATARITGHGSLVRSATGDMEFRPVSRRERRQEERLAAEEVEAREERERAAADLSKARERHRDALQAARLAATIREQGGAL